MADVIDLEGRKKQKQDLDKAERLFAVRSALQCSQCSRRCAKCGAQTDDEQPVKRGDLSFRFCPNCLAEYRDLTTYLEGEPNPDRPFWENKEWVRLWLAWLEYQEAQAKYLTSPEVLVLLQDWSKE